MDDDDDALRDTISAAKRALNEAMRAAADEGVVLFASVELQEARAGMRVPVIRVTESVEL